MEQDIENGVIPSESKIQLKKIIKASNFFLSVVNALKEEHLAPLDKYFLSLEKFSLFANTKQLIFKRAFAFRYFLVDAVHNAFLQNQLCALRAQINPELELSTRFEAWKELIRNPLEPILFDEVLLLAPLINQLLKIELLFTKDGLFEKINYTTSLPYLHLEVKGDGNCLFYAYALSLIDYLRQKKDERLTYAIFNKIPLLIEQERNALIEIIHDESCNLALHTKTVEDLLGSKLRHLAMSQLKQEFIARPKETQLFQVALYVARQMKEGVLDNFSDLIFVETEFIRKKFFQDFQKALSETRVLAQDIEQFIVDYFSKNNYEKLNCYLAHLNTQGQWGTDEQLYALQRAIRGEHVVGEEDHREVLCAHEIELKIHKEIDVIEGFSDINLYNDRNVHWSPIISSALSDETLIPKISIHYHEIEDKFYDEFEYLLDDEGKIIIQKLEKPQQVSSMPTEKTPNESTPHKLILSVEVDTAAERISRASSFSSQITEKGVSQKLSSQERALKRVQKYFKLSDDFTEDDFHKALLEKLKLKITSQSLEKHLKDYQLTHAKKDDEESELEHLDIDEKGAAFAEAQSLEDKVLESQPVSFFYLPEDKLYKAHELSGAITSQEVRLKSLMALDSKASFQSFLGPYVRHDAQLFLPVWEYLFATIIQKSTVENKKIVAKYFFNVLENKEDILCMALLAVHSKEYLVSLIEQCCEVEATSRPFKVSGAELEASEDVMLNQNTIELCLRPLISCVLDLSSVKFILGLPSHHAQIATPNGFCFINTLMVLAHIDKYRTQHASLRHLIVGTDVNRDNGIAEIVEKCELDNLHHIDLFDERVFPEESLEEILGEETPCSSGKMPKRPKPPVYVQEGQIVGYQLTPHQAHYAFFSKPALETNFYSQHKVYSPLPLNRFMRTDLEVIHPAIVTAVELLKKEVEQNPRLAIYIPWGVDSHIKDATFDSEKMTEEVKIASRFTSKDLAYFYDELLSLYESNRAKIIRIYISLEGGYDEKILAQELHVFIKKLNALNEVYYQSLGEKIEKNIGQSQWDLAILNLYQLLEKKDLSKKERSSCWEKLCYCYVQNQQAESAQMAYQKMTDYKNDLDELISFLFHLEVSKRPREEEECSEAPPRKRVRHLVKEDFRYLQPEGESYFEKIDKMSRVLLMNKHFDWTNQQKATRCKVVAPSHYQLMGSIFETLAFHGLFKQTLFDQLTTLSLNSLYDCSDKEFFKCELFLRSLVEIIHWIESSNVDLKLISKVDYLKCLISTEGHFKEEFVSILLHLKKDIGSIDLIPLLAKKYEEHGRVLLNKWPHISYYLRRGLTEDHLETLLKSLSTPPSITHLPTLFRQQPPALESKELCRQCIRN